MQLGRQPDIFTNSSGVIIIRKYILGALHSNAIVLWHLTACPCGPMKWDWDSFKDQKGKKKSLLHTHAHTHNTHKRRRTIKEEKIEDTKDRSYFLSVLNTVAEMAFYYKRPFTPYVPIISIWPGYRQLLEQCTAPPPPNRQAAPLWCHSLL